MDNSTWTWAFGQVVNAITTVFGYAISAFGAATVTIFFFIWFMAVLRLIIRPILGMMMSASFSEIERNTRRFAQQKQKQKADSSKNSAKN